MFLSALILAFTPSVSVSESEIIRPEEYYIHQGIEYAAEGDYLSAITILEKAAEIFPENGEVHYNLGYAYLMNGNNDLAAKQYTKLKELDEDMLAQDLLDWITMKDAGCTDKRDGGK